MARLLGLLFASTGCSLFGGLRVDALGSAAAPPGNVAAYVAVTRDGEPVSDLTADDFTIYENEQPVPPEQSRQLLLEREVVAAHHTLLLVDQSAASRPAEREQLSKAIEGFVQTVRASQPVTVYGFAGSGTLRLLGEYGRGSSEPLRLRTGVAPGDSRDLNGAVRRGLRELDQRLARSAKPIRVGTLAVFAAGPDLAGRVTDSELDAALAESKHFVVVIADGPDPAPELRVLGRDGLVSPQARDTLPIAFEEAAYKVRALYETHYLFAYCSPARAGERRLRLEVRLLDKDGNWQSGDVTTDFRVRGFTAACDPRRVPPFVAPRTAPNSASKKNAAPESESSPAASEAADDASVVPPPQKPGYAQ